MQHQKQRLNKPGRLIAHRSTVSSRSNRTAGPWDRRINLATKVYRMEKFAKQDQAAVRRQAISGGLQLEWKDRVWHHLFTSLVSVGIALGSAIVPN